jgi:ribosomal protein L24
MTSVAKIKAGSQVKLLVGSKDKRGSEFTVKKINGEKVYLDGYRLFNRTTKITQENTNTHKTVHHPVHISNVKLITESK